MCAPAGISARVMRTSARPRMRAREDWRCENCHICHHEAVSYLEVSEAVKAGNRSLPGSPVAPSQVQMRDEFYGKVSMDASGGIL